MNKTPFFLLIFALFITSCGKKQSTQISSDSFENLNSEFKSFYTKFLSDSAYQMSHIVFPLEGNTGNSEENSTWNEENWELHQPYEDPASEFTRTFEKLGDMMTLELIRHKELPYLIERRYAKLLGEDWYLVYYRIHNQIDEFELQE